VKKRKKLFVKNDSCSEQMIRSGQQIYIIFTPMLAANYNVQMMIK